MRDNAWSMHASETMLEVSEPVRSATKGETARKAEHGNREHVGDNSGDMCRPGHQLRSTARNQKSEENLDANLRVTAINESEKPFECRDSA